MDDPIETLERWSLHGGHWRVRELTSTTASVELLSCVGEPVERLSSGDPELLVYLRDRVPEAEEPARGP